MFTLHCLGVAFFDDGALDDITKVSSFMNLSGTCRLKQLLFKSLCNKNMHEHEQLKISICLEVAAIVAIFDAWETLAHA